MWGFNPHLYTKQPASYPRIAGFWRTMTNITTSATATAATVPATAWCGEGDNVRLADASTLLREGVLMITRKFACYYEAPTGTARTSVPVCPHENPEAWQLARRRSEGWSDTYRILNRHRRASAALTGQLSRHR